MGPRLRRAATTAIALAFPPAPAGGDCSAICARWRPGSHAAGRAVVEPARGRAEPAVRRRVRDEDDPQQPARRGRRFHKLVEAMKFVYASTFFENARDYRGRGHRPQGTRRWRSSSRRSSGAATATASTRSCPASRARTASTASGDPPEDGVVQPGVRPRQDDRGRRRHWSYSPGLPAAPAALRVGRDLLRQTQIEFWAVNMGNPPAYDPVREAEYLVQVRLVRGRGGRDAALVASTYERRLGPPRRMGVAGPRALTFAPLLVLEEYPLNDLLKRCCGAAEESLGAPVEIEFAVTFGPRASGPAGFGFLQVRPMAVSTAWWISRETVDPAGALLLASERVMGNGVVTGIRDVVYVKPGRFDARRTPAIAAEIARLNLDLVAEGIPTCSSASAAGAAPIRGWAFRSPGRDSAAPGDRRGDAAGR